MEILKLAVCGFGRRGRMCAWCSHNKKEEKRYEIAYVIDTNPEAIRLAIEEFGIPKEHCFTSLEEFYAAGITDCRAMAICTQDRQHFPHAMSALEHGYDLLVEKPVSYCAEECVALAEAAKKFGKDIFVCHVLRYAPFYMKMREIIKSGVLGEVVNVMATENVGIVNHYSASFIRGPWHRSDTTSPMILAKSCHDMDIILYLTGLSCVSLNSYGNRFYFNEEHKPEGAAERCLDCKHKDDCIFYAPTVYQKEKDNNGWLKNMIAADPTDEIVQKAMEEGREGNDLYPEIKRRSFSGEYLDKRQHDLVRHEIMKRFGYYNTESSEHTAEYSPYFIKAKYPELIERFRIPLDEYPRRCVNQINEWKQMRGKVLSEDIEHIPSREFASNIVNAMVNDVPYTIHGNVLNKGFITNLPTDACVEVKCLVDGRGVTPCYVGALPEQLAALNRTNINVQNMTIQAAKERKKELVYMAAYLDPHTAAELSMDDIKNMCDELFAAHKDWLPNYD